MRLICILMLATVSAVSSFASFIREDRIWNYSMIGGEGEISLYRFQMKFDGTKDIEGKTYHIFKTVSIMGYKYVKEPPYFIPVEAVEPNAHEYYLYEEDDKVSIYRYGAEESDDQYSEREFPLYDFNALPGGTFRSIGSFGDVIEMNVTDEKYATSIDGTSLRMFEVEWKLFHDSDETERLTVVEGVGFVSPASCVPFFSQAICSCSWYGDYPQNLPESGYRGLSLDSVTDLEGNIIFSTEMLDDVSVESVKDSDSGMVDGGIYDMMGREVKEMQPGGVYIRNGRKFIGK